MKKYLIDANLPRKIKVWQTEDFEFVSEINDEWTDSEIWDYAKQNKLIIVSKDADFSHRIMVSNSPPKIIHIKIGNMKLRDFESAIEKVWKRAENLCETHKLVNIFIDRIEAVN
jgi:predicted nuclease of predicted toxin-antitoxin system